MKDIELDVGGTKFKGVWIAVILSFASTLAGGIWTASEFFSRLEVLESRTQSALSINTNFDNLEKSLTASVAEFDTKISNVQQQLEDNDISQLQGKLAELGANLATIMEQQKSLMDLKERVTEINSVVEKNTIIVDVATKTTEGFDSSVKVLEKEIDDLWKALDAVSNPLGS